jgi:hypothetical protein
MTTQGGKARKGKSTRLGRAGKAPRQGRAEQRKAPGLDRARDGAYAGQSKARRLLKRGARLFA